MSRRKLWSAAAGNLSTNGCGGGVLARVTDLTYSSAVELLADLDARRLSARELLDVHVERHEQVHGEINAVVATDLERARADAAAVDEARVRGERLGQLAGLPMTIKDGFDVAGLPAVSGSPALVGRPKDCSDADVVASARRAGAVLWGKTNVPLMLEDWQSYNKVYGATNNPYDLTRTPGGSSGGAAAALAAGVTPLEIGSDIAGSLRIPANFCGVYALKPTFGVLSPRGSVPPGPDIHVDVDLLVAGPMARTAADLRLLWDVLCGRPSATPTEVTGARVALWLDEPEFVVSEQVRGGLLAAADALRGQGVAVEVTAPVPAGELLDTYLALLFPILTSGLPDEVFARLLAERPAAEAALAAGTNRYGPEAFAVYGTAIYRDVAMAQVTRQRLKNRLAHWFASGWDAVLCPVAPMPAFAHQHDDTIALRVLEMDGGQVNYSRLFDWVALASALHAPAVAVPVVHTPEGVPVGVQLIGRWGEENRLLDFAAALERATGGFQPPVHGPA